MHVDGLLAAMRRRAEEWQGSRDPHAARDALVELGQRWLALDSYLSQGGRPPAAWSEGPDAPYMDCGHHMDRPIPRADRPARDDDYTAEAVDRDASAAASVDAAVLFDRGQPFERPNVIDPRDVEPLGPTNPAGVALP